jgi:hypothetical protein
MRLEYYTSLPYYDTETSATILEYAIKEASSQPWPLLFAVYLLEVNLAVDENAAPSVFKNAGLAHIHLIQNKHFSQEIVIPHKNLTLFQSLVNISWPTNEQVACCCSEHSADRSNLLL